MSKREQLRAYLQKMKSARKKKVELDIDYVLAALEEASQQPETQSNTITVEVDGGEF